MSLDTGLSRCVWPQSEGGFNLRRQRPFLFAVYEVRPSQICFKQPDAGHSRGIQGYGSGIRRLLWHLCVERDGPRVSHRRQFVSELERDRSEANERHDNRRRTEVFATYPIGGWATNRGSMETRTIAPNKRAAGDIPVAAFSHSPGRANHSEFSSSGTCVPENQRSIPSR